MEASIPRNNSFVHVGPSYIVSWATPYHRAQASKMLQYEQNYVPPCIILPKTADDFDKRCMNKNSL